MTDLSLGRRILANADGVRRMGAAYAAKFIQYESDRRLAELKWARNARQFLGLYDPTSNRIWTRTAHARTPSSRA
jgi:hypothetical protein